MYQSTRGGGLSGMGLEMPGIELVNPGLLGLHHICLERGRDRKTCRDFDRQTDRQRNAIDTNNLRVFNIRGSSPHPLLNHNAIGGPGTPKIHNGYQAPIQCWAIKWHFAGGPMMARL